MTYARFLRRLSMPESRLGLGLGTLLTLLTLLTFLTGALAIAV
jgi:hypothetical protein